MKGEKQMLFFISLDGEKNDFFVVNDLVRQLGHTQLFTYLALQGKSSFFN
jgi:hypothetical protein